MHKKIWFVLAVVFCITGIGAVPMQTVPPLIRLHVLAESDSAEHQAQKLIVRDAVLAASQQLLSECTDYREAYSILDERLGDILAAAQGASDAPVSASLTREHYPDRDYGEFTLPEGDYTSLRVMIGEGAGQNWWCVVYPSLCMPQNAQQMPETIEIKPLRSVVWEWLRGLWTDMEEARHIV